jgi:molybdopterin-guanine dinucleotide biosynthesis protein A
MGVDLAVAAVVLAGGRGTRMGGDKATMAVGGVPMARRVAEVAALVADPVLVVAPAGHPAASLAGRLGLATVADPAEGPLPALAAGLGAVAAEHVLALATDHPGLRPELLALLVATRRDAPAVACRGPGGRLEPLVAVYERAPALAEAQARVAAGIDRSLRGLLGALGARVLEPAEWRVADPDGRSFTDLDRPEDVRAWELGRRPG